MQGFLNQNGLKRIIKEVHELFFKIYFVSWIDRVEMERLTLIWHKIRIKRGLSILHVSYFMSVMKSYVSLFWYIFIYSWWIIFVEEVMLKQRKKIFKYYFCVGWRVVHILDLIIQEYALKFVFKVLYITFIFVT